jgi:hypothetical protein
MSWLNLAQAIQNVTVVAPSSKAGARNGQPTCECSSLCRREHSNNARLSQTRHPKLCPQGHRRILVVGVGPGVVLSPTFFSG